MEEYRDGYVSLAVGNVRPGETVTVLLELLAGVEIEERRVRFRFPFTLAPCYHREMRVGLIDADTGEIELPEEAFGDLPLPPLARDAEGLHRVSFDLGIEMPVPVAEVASPSHRIAVRLDGGRRPRAALAAAGDVPNRDLVLDVRLDAPLEGVLWGEAPDGSRHFAAVVPPGRFGSAGRVRRRIAFVLDRSGSMGGAPMEAARRALLACLGALGPEDEVGVVAFDDRVDRLTRGLERATDRMRSALRGRIEAIGARGGTELLSGLEAGLAMLGREDGEIFLITDGQVYATEEIVAAVEGSGARIHCLGIGAASQDRFLAALAARTGGVARMVTPREAVDEAALELFADAGAVVASALEVRPADGAAVEKAPEPPAVVTGGRPLVIWGEAAGGGRLQLAWKRGGEPGSLELELGEPPERPPAAVALLRGARLISAVEAVMVPGGEDEAVERLEALGRRFGLANRALALVAVAERAGDRPGEPPVTRMVPVGMPEDVEFEAYFPRRRHLARGWPRRRVAYGEGAALTVEDAGVAYSKPEEVVVECYVPGLSPEESPRRRPRPGRALVRAAMALAGRMAADGGLPGPDLTARVAATLGAAVLFLAAGPRKFRPHLERAAEFVEGHLDALDPERQELAEEVLEALEKRDLPDHDWKALAAALEPATRDEEPDPEAVWSALEAAFG